MKRITITRKALNLFGDLFDADIPAERIKARKFYQRVMAYKNNERAVATVLAAYSHSLALTTGYDAIAKKVLEFRYQELQAPAVWK
jgi:hypothetical protein